MKKYIFKELIINGRYQIPWFITNECFDLIKKCLTPNPKRRIKIADIRNHVWLCQLQSIVEPKEPIINQNVLNVMENVGIGMILTILHNILSVT